MKCHLLEKYNTASSQILQPSRQQKQKSTMLKEGESTALLEVRLSFWLCHQQTVRQVNFTPLCLGLLNKVLPNWIQYHIKKKITHDHVAFIPSSQGWFNTCKPINVIYHINKRQKPHGHLNRCRKSMWQNSTSIHDKNSCQSGYGGNVSQNNRSYLWQTHRECNTSGEKWRVFLLKSGTKQGCPLSSHLFNIVL